MSHRQEEKKRRREEREARERAEKARAAARKRLQIALGGLIAVAAVAVVVLLVSGTVGGSGGGEESAASAPEASNVPIPAQEIGDLKAAAEAAGCKLENPKLQEPRHEERIFTPKDYNTNPPTSGRHFPNWAQDGVYPTGSTPPLGELVHTLEHGRIDVQYKPGTPEGTVDQLNSLLAEMNDGYHLLLFENQTEMEAQVAATGWGRSLTCPEMNDQVFDAIRTFRNEYIDKGPEQVP